MASSARATCPSASRWPSPPPWPRLAWRGAAACSRPAGDSSPERRSAGRVEPLAHRHVVRGVLAGRELAPELSEHAGPVGGDVVLVDRLEVLLARGDERVVAQLRELLDDAA